MFLKSNNKRQNVISLCGFRKIRPPENADYSPYVLFSMS